MLNFFRITQYLSTFYYIGRCKLYRMKKLYFLLLLVAISVSLSSAQSHVLWMQQPAISPDGNWIAFEYKGNIFKVASTGGAAIPRIRQVRKF